MTLHPRSETSADCVASAPPAEFIAACVAAFVASVSATIYFCRSMCCEMEMPGGWTLSMMWMRMQDQSWAASAASFQLMWLAMMVVMMLPSALPMFLNTKRAPASLCVMASGYFAVWLAAGVGIYALGVAFAAAAMRWEIFSDAVPVLSGAALIAAGAFQFTRWKMTGLNHWRKLEISQRAKRRTIMRKLSVFNLVTLDWCSADALKNDAIIAQGMNSASKIVFSRTLKKADWANTQLVKDNLPGEVRKLKKQSGKGLTILGSGSIVAQLAQAGMIDEYQLLLNPVILGKGRTMFEGVEGKPTLKLTSTRTFGNGNVLLCYEPTAASRRKT